MPVINTTNDVIIPLVSALIGAGLGYFANIKASSTVEQKVNSKLFESLYIELGDLADECLESLDLLYDLYAQGYASERFKHDIKTYVTPRPLQILMLESISVELLPKLTRPQRDSIRTLIYLGNKAKNSLLEIQEVNPSGSNDLSLDYMKIKCLISTYGVMYQLANLMAETKIRYVLSEKKYDEVFKDTMALKGISFTSTDIINYINNKYPISQPCKS